MQQKALEFALKSMTAKRQTESQMREKISKRFPKVDVEKVIERLKELDYLDDKEFCFAWIRHRSLSSPRGKYALNRELKLKGISDVYISEALEEFEEMPVLGDLAARKWLQINEKNLFKKKQKLMRFLLARGFEISKVIDVMNSLEM